MGYTHYFELRPGAYDQQEYNRRFADAVETTRRCADVARQNGISLKGGYGGAENDPEPEFLPDRIWFNGDDTDGKGLAHETFYVPREPDPGDFTFCKTARKPYDIVVCCALLALWKHLPEAFSFHSDGDLNDTEWQDGLALFNEHSGWNISPEELNSYLT